jgi:hypothetical protein
MQAHLDQGCRSCAQIVELWRTVLDVARREKRFQPLESDLRLAWALFAAYPPAKAGRLKLLVARLMDCNRLSLEGSRRSEPSSQGHFMFQREDLFLDLQFRIDANCVSMVGQILDPAAPEPQYGDTAIKLVRDQEVVAQTTTNEFGEFRLEYRLQRNLLLVIELEEQTHLITPLPHPSEAGVYGGGAA